MNAVGPGALAPSLVFASPAGPVNVPNRDGSPVVLIFFQEASTPRCTTQVQTLYREDPILRELGAVIYFASTDPPDRQIAFAESIGVPGATFLHDAAGAGARAYGVYDEDSGRAMRAAFVIGGDGVVRVAIPWYNPENSDQLLSIFTALGWDAVDTEDENDG